MVSLIIQFSRYAILILMAIYTMQSYIVFSKNDEDDKDFLFIRQNLMMFMIHFIAFMIMYLKKGDLNLMFLYGAQFIYLAATLVFFRNLYPRASKLVVNHMCMLITIGFIMITRLSFDEGVKQFKIVIISTVVALLIPAIIRKVRVLTKWTWLYAIIGIGGLGVVAVAAQTTYGAKLGFVIGGISVQPSEFIKIIFVFCIAGMLGNAKNFKDIVIATVVAALHVLILVYSTDLGSALIYFVTYLVMLYVATRKMLYALAGGGSRIGGCGRSLSPLCPYPGTSRDLAESICGLFRKWLSGGTVTFCHGSRRLAWNRYHEWYTGQHSTGGDGLYVLSHHRRTGRPVCHLRDSGMYELLYYVREHCHAAFQPILPSGSTGTGNHVCRSGVPDGRRCHEVHSDDRSDPSAGQLRRKFYAEYRHDVCNYSGTVYSSGR